MFDILAEEAGEIAGWDRSLFLATLLVGLGFVFLIAELFVVSFGALTMCALGSFAAAVVIAFNRGPVYGWTYFIILVVLVPAVIIMGLRIMPRTSWGKKLIPPNPKLEDVTATGIDRSYEELLGKAGVTSSVCRPAGTAEIDDEPYDVVSEGTMIAADRPVTVVEVEGNRIVVREVEEEA